jgi:hypothetical protein
MRQPRFPTRRVLLAIVIAALAGLVAYAVQRELTPAVQAALPVAKAEPHRALSAEEETYAAALWPLHSEVKLAAIRMTFAGLAFKTEHHDPQRLAATVRPLGETITTVTARMGALEPPPTLRAVHDRYLQALTLYAAASGEMIEGALADRNDLLIEAQGKSFRASEDLLRVSDALWPGEYKPH